MEESDVNGDGVIGRFSRLFLFVVILNTNERMSRLQRTFEIEAELFEVNMTIAF